MMEFVVGLVGVFIEQGVSVLIFEILFFTILGNTLLHTVFEMVV